LTVLERSLRLLHPVMPHLTEELWQRIPGHHAFHGETISLAPYPTPPDGWIDEPAERGVGALIGVVGRIRSMRAELEIPAKADVTVYLDADDPETGTVLEELRDLAAFLLRTDDLRLERPPEGVPNDLVHGVRLGIQAGAVVLDGNERRRLEAEAKKLDSLIAAAEDRLANRQFVERAPEAVVAGQREQLDEMKRRREQIVAGTTG